jgi:hypothetical protein
MKQSEIFRENAEHCAHLAEGATNHASYRRSKGNAFSASPISCRGIRPSSA